MQTRRLGAVLLAGAAVAAGAGCGNLDNVTTVKDLRVLAVRAEPAGFLVDLDHPDQVSADALHGQLTALVVDPKGAAQEVDVTGRGCPDYIDTITAATGKGSKLCPDPIVDSSTIAKCDSLPSTLATGDAPAVASPVMPVATSPIQYEPAVGFGLQPCQIGLFFSPTPTGVASVDQSVALNRDYGLAAIVNMNFTLGTESALAIKRLVYWPRLPPDLLPDPNPLPGDQQPNQNPTLTSVDLYRHRDQTTGDPDMPWDSDPPTLSIAAGDKLFVNPVAAPDAAEPYFLREKDVGSSVVTTRFIERELLTFEFYATAGTFAPASRQSELSPFLTQSPGATVHVDSQYQLPKEADLPEGGKITIWVVVRDERTGTNWYPRDIIVTP
jgi:hypothetical protein